MTDLTKEVRMADLIDILNDAARRYYTSDEETPITDAQYDRYLGELVSLEADTGIRLFGSPTLKVGFSESEENKVQHYSPILSLKDTKNIDELLHFLGEREGILSWKLDGVSIVLYYADGILERAVSRGDGHWGKDITKNVILMRDVPINIFNKGYSIIRGEGCISLKDFEAIRETKDGEAYKNPRNMVSGLINSTKNTNDLLQYTSFIAHSVVLFDGADNDFSTRHKQLGYLKKIGFTVVSHTKVLNFELKAEIERYTNEIDSFEFPVDGLVLSLNDIRYGDTLGSTAKYPKHSMAFKWPDETAMTTVTGMKWSVSPTGYITPVVIFAPVMLEGTEVKQANLHSLKIFKEFEIGIGDTIKVFKANKIIPQVEENYTRSGTEPYPTQCPICDVGTMVVTNETTEKLYCTNCRN